MNIIIYEWGSNSDRILKEKLDKLGYDIVIFSGKCEHYTKDLRFAQEMINLIHEMEAEAVISFDYFPIISMICNTVGIRYYSWVYDSPHYTLYARTSGYNCNRIGCFDRAMVDRLHSLGIQTVFHLPLGVDWSGDTDTGLSYGNSTAHDKGREDDRYKCDVSFVGSLYTGEYNYYDSLCDDEMLRKRADKIIGKQCFEYRTDYIGDFFEDGSGDGADREITYKIRNIIEKEKLFPGDEYIKDIKYIFDSYFLEKKVTVEERRRLLEKVVEMDIDFKLYTGSDLSKLPELMKASQGYIDYHREMPKVFKNSRINLNISLRSIKTGIPLRALDIMGCGGFLLSNYQEEIKEYFREGEELVMFYGLEDCLEKMDYYLKHENERERIAIAGYKAVHKHFDFLDQLRKLLEI